MSIKFIFDIYRTIGFCCGCFGCTSPCCQNQDSLNDPCGSQYTTLTYLLRHQKPTILYANFLGAFHRGRPTIVNQYRLDHSLLAPFYIAADHDKKTIVVSIRGTLSATDVLTDINAVEDALQTELFGNGQCHSGKYFLSY